MLRSRPFLMFTGQAEAALALYAEAFADFRLLALQRHPEGAGAGVPGQVRQAIFLLGGTHYLCFDSLDVHDFTFTPVHLVVRRVFRRRAVRARGTRAGRRWALADAGGRLRFQQPLWLGTGPLRRVLAVEPGADAGPVIGCLWVWAWVHTPL